MQTGKHGRSQLALRHQIASGCPVWRRWCSAVTTVPFAKQQRERATTDTPHQFENCRLRRMRVLCRVSRPRSSERVGVAKGRSHAHPLATRLHVRSSNTMWIARSPSCAPPYPGRRIDTTSGPIERSRRTRTPRLIGAAVNGGFRSGIAELEDRGERLRGVPGGSFHIAGCESRRPQQFVPDLAVDMPLGCSFRTQSSVPLPSTFPEGRPLALYLLNIMQPDGAAAGLTQNAVERAWLLDRRARSAAR
jgi:hypothetical protein